jgi:hypothetical protein
MRDYTAFFTALHKTDDQPHAALHKLQSAVKTGSAEDDWIVALSLAIVGSLCIISVVMLSELFLMSHGWLWGHHR